MVCLRRAALVSVCIAMAGSGCSTSDDSARFLHEKGHVLLNQRKLPEALAAYQQAAAKDPGNPSIPYDIGVVYGQMDQFEEAVEAYSKSIQIDPRNPQALNNRGVAYGQLRQFKKSLEDCTKAIEFEPNESIAYRNRGLAHQGLGDLEAALTDFNAAVRLGPQIPEGLLARASVYQEQQQYQLALQDCNAALKLVPNSAQALMQRGLAQRSLGKAELAERDFTAAKKADPNIVIPVQVSAAKPVGTLPVDAQARALEIALKYLPEHGYTDLKRTNGDSPGELTAQTKDGPVEIDVQVALPSSAVRLSKDDLRRLREHGSRLHLLVVGRIDLKKPNSGEVLGLRTTWPPKDDQLVPVEFEVSVEP